MNFQITEIEFDFEIEDDIYCTKKEQQTVIEDTLGTIWEADDEDDLIEEITCATGWCIKKIDYRITLDS